MINQKQVEKVFKGKWNPIKELWAYSHQWQCSKCGFPTLTNRKQFCDECGTAMSDDAVDVVMKRLELLKDADWNNTVCFYLL